MPLGSRRVCAVADTGETSGLRARTVLGLTARCLTAAHYADGCQRWCMWLTHARAQRSPFDAAATQIRIVNAAAAALARASAAAIDITTRAVATSESATRVPSTAITSRLATAATTLLMPEATPVSRSFTELMTVVVSGATVMAIPKPSTIIGPR